MSYHHGDLPRAAVERAYAIVTDRSHDDLSVRELADDLGVTPRAIYRHLGDRHGLLVEVAARAFEELCDEVERVLDASPEDARVATMSRYVAFAITSPTRYRLMFGLGDDALRQPDALGEQVRRLIKLTERAVATRAPELAGRARRDHIIGVWGLCHGLIEFYFGGTLRAASPAQAERYVCGQMIRMIQDHDR